MVDGTVLERLRGARGFLFDMDGTMVLGDRRNHGLMPLPGSVELVEVLTERGVPFVLFTNGTTRTPAEYARLLRDVGFDVQDEALLTPASSAVDCFLRRGHRTVMVLGGSGLTEPLRDAGIDTVPPVPGERADAVLAGWYRELTFDSLEAACEAVWAGARYYSSSQSQFFATAQGRALGTSRAISAVVRDLTGCRVEVVGKPSLQALRTAAHRLGVAPTDLAVVGDDPELEIPMAHHGHALAVGVHTGLSDAAAFDALPPDQRPHLSVAGVDELLTLYLGGPPTPW